MVVRTNVLEYIIALVFAKNKVRLKKCLKALIVTRKRGNGRYYFAL
jgi:hypothetical protein